MWDRRTFMRAAGAGFAAGLLPAGAEALERAEAIIASACLKPDGKFGVVLMSETGRIISALDLPDRGHDVTQCLATGRLVAFARQPGTFAVVLSRQGEGLATIASAPGRHFYGHGVFSPDGRLLYATENDFDNAAGIVGVYDATDGFHRVGEFASGGVGPHDLLLSADGRYLCVANGGIQTHPDFGRTKLNLSSMQPNLAWIDRDNGTVIAVQGLPDVLHQLSLRHLAAGRDERIWVGAQYEGPQDQIVPLVGAASPEDGFAFAHLPDPVTVQLANYVASIAALPGGGEIAVTSPIGNIAVILDETGRLLSVKALKNVSGVAGTRAGFALSTGDGVFRANQQAAAVMPGVEFDNHLFLAG
ncbi:MAG: DUF1513 domain-containing protein [Cucumibacter sp.]